MQFNYNNLYFIFYIKLKIKNFNLFIFYSLLLIYIDLYNKIIYDIVLYDLNFKIIYISFN